MINSKEWKNTHGAIFSTYILGCFAVIRDRKRCAVRLDIRAEIDKSWTALNS